MCQQMGELPATSWLATSNRKGVILDCVNFRSQLDELTQMNAIRDPTKSCCETRIVVTASKIVYLDTSPQQKLDEGSYTVTGGLMIRVHRSHSHVFIWMS
ncbi:MAG: hypothetical protein M1831_007363 [Alyxoria varia]|nr:MAG: hypothetical protein M1831_007363 [Alyxoria varia]